MVAPAEVVHTAVALPQRDAAFVGGRPQLAAAADDVHGGDRVHGGRVRVEPRAQPRVAVEDEHAVAPATAQTSVPSVETARSLTSALSVTVSGADAASRFCCCCAGARRGSHTQSVRSASALHTRQRSAEAFVLAAPPARLVSLPSGDQMGSIALRAAPPPGMERRHSAVRASHMRMAPSSAPESTTEAPTAGADGGGPGEQMHVIAPPWPPSAMRSAKSPPARTAILPSVRPAHTMSSQPKPSAAPARLSGPARSGGAGRTVSTTARHVVGAEVEAEQRSAPECVDQATTRPSEPPGPSPPTKTRPAARAVSATPREWCRGARTRRGSACEACARRGGRRLSGSRRNEDVALEVVAMLEAGML